MVPHSQIFTVLNLLSNLQQEILFNVLKKLHETLLFFSFFVKITYHCFQPFFKIILCLTFI